MMAYRVVEMQETLDGYSLQLINAYDTKESALMAYHQALAGCYASTQLKAFSVVCLNAHGGTEAKEYWEKPYEPEPPVNEEP